MYYWRETLSDNEEDELVPIHVKLIIAKPAEAVEVNLPLSISLNDLSKMHIKHLKE